MNRSPPAVRPFVKSMQFAAFLLCGWQGAAAELPSTLRLAIDLADRGDAAGAAVEFRRLAIDTADRAERAAYEWVAAREHARARAFDLSERMLDRAEDSGVARTPCLLLRAENAEATDDPAAAAFFWSGLGRDGGAPADARAYAARRLAAVHLAEGRFDDAAAALRTSPRDESAALTTVESLRTAPRKSPRIGGLLGMIPGLGYAYSGEYANAGRSLILNGLFIGLMVLAADDDNWGVFGLAGFFEITAYTGSIYGGIDAAHRWNRERTLGAIRTVEGDARWAVDYRELPLLRLRFSF